MKSNIILISTLISLILFCSCKQKSDVEKVEEWYHNYSQSPVIDSLNSYDISLRDDYLLLFLGSDSLRVIFLINPLSTLEDFHCRYRINNGANQEYHEGSNLDSVTSKYIIEAKKVFRFYVKLGRIGFSTYKV
jgi:hypothetical protein